MTYLSGDFPMGLHKGRATCPLGVLHPPSPHSVFIPPVLFTLVTPERTQALTRASHSMKDLGKWGLEQLFVLFHAPI